MISILYARLLVQATRRSTISDRVLAVASPRAWNNLPVYLCLSRTFFYFQNTPEVTSVQHIFPFSLTVSLM